MSSKLLHHEQCPSCSAKGEDREGNNLGVYDDGHKYCFKEGLFFPADNVEGFINLSEDFTYEYISHRGLNTETLKFYDIKTKINSEGKPVSVGFRWPNDTYKVRSLDKKEFFWSPDGSKCSQAGLFGRDKFSQGAHKYVTITEGEYDAASLHQVLRGPVVSVQSSGSAKRDCTVDYDWLNSFERIYLAFDNDTAGREATRNVAKLFDYNKLYVVRFSKRKDANDYLQAGEGDELKNIWWNSKKYLPESIVSSFAEFEEILKEQKKAGVPYPFRTLNDMTYGIRTGEMVLLTAQEKVGKTSIMHAIEYQLLKETKDAVGAIFLEEPKRRHLEALAGLELRKPVHLPDHAVDDAVLLGAIKKLVGQDDRLHVYSHFGSDNPEILLDTIRFLVTARSCRYILFDHFTMAVSGLQGEDERRALDYLATRLEMMVKELDFSLIAVSHVNDEGKTRGSRYLTKVADITIQAERDPLAHDLIERNTIHLKIPYNRFAARSGPAGSLRLDPETYLLEEVFDTPANDNGRNSALVAKQVA